jgi:phytanoyl-CoA hydroxylase
MKSDFLTRGFSAIENFVPHQEMKLLHDIYNTLLEDTERTKGLRSDLSGINQETKKERIVQIMTPSSLMPDLRQTETYTRATATAKAYLGSDMELDFDMMINKPANSLAETPWHQDAAYWIKMPDKRAVSIWIALDATSVENGCMWFLPRNQETIVPHRQPTPGAALSCEPPTKGAIAMPLPQGGCTLHDGYTLHYSRGNSTTGPRRGLILNYRPEAMIALERKLGYDHTGNKEVKQS